MKEKAINTLRIIIVSFIFSTAIGYSFAAWTPPAGSPPFGNTPPPINVGDATQERKGNLILDNWLFAKKAQTQSTVAADDPKTLTTKDYVDAGLARKWVSFDVLGGANRALGTEYTNTSGHEIVVSAWTYSGCHHGGTGKGACDAGVSSYYENNDPKHCSISIIVDGVIAAYNFSNRTNFDSLLIATDGTSVLMCGGTAVVPNNSKYKVITDWADIKLYGWSELR